MDSKDRRRRLQQRVDAHFSAVGKVAAFWSEFERQLQMTIWKLAEIDTFSGACITSRIDGSAKLLECIRALIQLKGLRGEDLQFLTEFCEEVAELQRQRDKIVNDPWSFRIVDAFPHRKELEAHKKPEQDHVPHSTKEVEAVAETISDLLQRFQVFLSDAPLLASTLDKKSQ